MLDAIQSTDAGSGWGNSSLGGPDGRIEPTYGLPKGVIRQIAFSHDLLSFAVTGQSTDEEWRQRIAERFQLELSSKRATAVTPWSRFTGEVDWEIVSILQRCGPSVRWVLITNATTRLERVLQNFCAATGRPVTEMWVTSSLNQARAIGVSAQKAAWKSASTPIWSCWTNRSTLH